MKYKDYHSEHSHGKKDINITKARNNSPNKTKKMLDIQKNKYTNQTFNDVAFPKQDYSFSIDKYLFVR